MLQEFKCKNCKELFKADDSDSDVAECPKCGKNYMIEYDYGLNGDGFGGQYYWLGREVK